MSKGRDLVVIPNFVGMTIEEATKAATDAGVEIDASGVFTKKRKVLAQAPPAGGDKVPRGTVVTIFFSPR